MNANSTPPIEINLKDTQAEVFPLTSEKVNFRIPSNQVVDADKAKAEAGKIREFIEQRNNKPLYVIDSKTGLDYLVEVNAEGKEVSRLPISHQLFTDGLAGRLNNVPDYNNSWNRLEWIRTENIDGENYGIFKQIPSHKSWLSTRYNQIFNDLKLTPGNAHDEAIGKKIIKLSAKKGRKNPVDADTSKINAVGYTDNSGTFGSYDLITTQSGLPKDFATKEDSKEGGTLAGHILIQKDDEIYIPLSAIPLEDRILMQTPVNPAIEKPDTAKPDTSNAIVVGNKVLYIDAGMVNIVDLNKWGAYVGAGVEANNWALGAKGLIPVTRDYKSDSLWSSTYGYTSNEVHQKIKRSQLGIEGLFGGKNFKIGLGVDYNKQTSELGGTFHEELTDMNGNTVVNNDGDLPTQDSTKEWVTYGPRIDINAGNVGITGGINYSNKPGHNPEYFAGLRLFLGQRDKHKDTYKPKLKSSSK